MVTLTQEQAEQALKLLTTYANSGVADAVSLECAQVCGALRGGLTALEAEQQAENVHLTVEGEALDQLRRERDGLLTLIAVLWQDNCRQVGNGHLTALHNVNRIRAEMAVLGLPILSDVEPHPLLGAAWRLHHLALEASRTDSTSKAVRAARDELVSECLKLEGKD